MDFSLLDITNIPEIKHNSQQSYNYGDSKESYEKPDERQDNQEKEEHKPPSMNFFNWREIFPELSVIYENQAIILEELQNIPNVSHLPSPWQQRDCSYVDIASL